MSYFIIANIIYIITNHMSCLVCHLLPIAELERARQMEDLPRTIVFRISCILFHVSGSPRIAAASIRYSALHEVAFQLDLM